MKELIKKPVTKLNIFYIALIALLYCGFWLGYYFLNVEWAVGLGIAVVVIPLILFFIFKKNTAVVIILGLFTGIGLGLSISAFFIHFNLVPSKFFGLVLLILIGLKCLQSYICSIFKYKKIYLITFIVIEITAVILVAVYAHINYALMAQIAFGLGVGFFLSLGQIGYFSKSNPVNSWRNAATGLFIGYVIIIIIIISLIAESGDGLETLGDIGDIGATSNKKKKDI